MNNKSRQLAYLLRHDKTYSFGRYGWRSVEDLIANHQFSMADLESIVLNNDKLRFEFSDDKFSIRACQGHSIKVDVELFDVSPPLMLFHGTMYATLNSILHYGIHKGKRLYVHLSESMDDALKVGRRHGMLAVIQIDTRRMYLDGYKFYLSRNGVWLTEFVEPKYIVNDYYYI